jgi:hypothetical protein
MNMREVVKVVVNSRKSVKIVDYLETNNSIYEFLYIYMANRKVMNKWL